MHYRAVGDQVRLQYFVLQQLEELVLALLIEDIVVRLVQAITLALKLDLDIFDLTLVAAALEHLVEGMGVFYRIELGTRSDRILVVARNIH
jgi:hypothetical protein